MSIKKYNIAFLLILMITMSFTVVNAANEQKMMNLLTEKQEVITIFKELGDNLQEAEQVKGKISMDRRGLIEDESRVAIKEFVFDFDAVNNGNKNSILFALNLNKHDFAKGEFATSDKLYAINIENFTDGMIGIRNEELEKLAKKFGMAETDIEEIKKALDAQPQYTKSQSEKTLKIFEKGIEKTIKNKVKVEKNVEVLDEEKAYNTTKYTVTVDFNMYMDGIINIINELKKDKEIYNIVMKNYAEENGMTIEAAKQEIDEAIKQIEDTKKQFGKLDSSYSEMVLFEISAYEKDGKNIATEISSEGTIMRLKAFDGKETDVIELEMTGENVGDMHIRLTINQSKEKFDAVLRVFGKEIKTTYEFDETWSLKTIRTEKNHDAEILKINMLMNKKADRKIVAINNKNTFVLNDKSLEEIKRKGERMVVNAEKFEGKMEKILEGYVDPTVERAKFSAFLMECMNIENEFMYAEMELYEKAGIAGTVLSREQSVVAIAIGEKDINNIKKLDVNKYWLNLSDVLPEYELSERLKDKKVCKITNPQFINDELGEIFIDSSGYSIYLKAPYKYYDELYINDIDIVKLKE